MIMMLALAVAVAYPGATVHAQVPGPELFAKEPRTPLELWDAVDYLLRTKQPKKALPYVDKFLKSKPNDATLIAIRNRYGPGSILRLSDDATTQPFAKPMAEAMVAAARNYATQPQRIRRLISELTKTPEEQDYAVRRLREAGPDSVPFLVEALARPGLSASDRTLIVHHMGRLDRSVIPALAAVLDTPDLALVVDAATALGMIGDREAIPYLTFPAASPATAPVVRGAAQAAIAQLTGQSFSAQPRSPTQVLTDTAWQYHHHKAEFPDDSVIIWSWDDNRKAPVSRRAPCAEADAMLGLHFAHQALRLDPGNTSAQTAQLSLMLERSISRVGFNAFPAQDLATFNAAKTAGPLILTEVIRSAIANRKTDLAAAAVAALSQITHCSALAATGHPHPLVDAVCAPGRRLQFAAAKGLVNLAPTDPFPGSSRIVPTLARFVVNQTLPRAVVIDGNPNRGSQLAGLLINLGYDPELELTGVKGFEAAAGSADVELILISYDLFRPGWSLNDTLANLEVDARTATVPIYIYGPINAQYKRPNLERDYSGIKFLVQPIEPATLQYQLKGLPTPLTEAERTGYASEAAMLLARIASDRKGPLQADLTSAEPMLAVAVGAAHTGPAAAIALSHIPDPNAQRRLADIALDPSQPTLSRKQSIVQLVHSIKRFGRLVTGDQEARLVNSLRRETDPDVRADLSTILSALLPHPATGLSPSPARLIPAAQPTPVSKPAVPP